MHFPQFVRLYLQMPKPYLHFQNKYPSPFTFRNGLLKAYAMANGHAMSAQNISNAYRHIHFKPINWQAASRACPSCQSTCVYPKSVPYPLLNSASSPKTAQQPNNQETPCAKPTQLTQQTHPTNPSNTPTQPHAKHNASPNPTPKLLEPPETPNPPQSPSPETPLPPDPPPQSKFCDYKL